MVPGPIPDRRSRAMDGQRIAKSEGSRKRGWIIAGAAASVLAAAYLTTCAWVSGDRKSVV